MASIILTRTEEENARSARALEAHGHAVFSAPMIELRAIDPGRETLERIARSLDGRSVLLTSAHATGLWLRLRSSVFSTTAPHSYLVVGASSARLLEERDRDVPLVAVASSARELLARVPTSRRRVLYPCSAARRHEIVDGLRQRGVDLIELPLYEPVLPEQARGRLAAVLRLAPTPRVLCFYSPSAVDNWFSLRSDIPPDSIFVAIGPTTAESLRAHGVSEIAVADSADGDAVAVAVERSLPGGA